MVDKRKFHRVNFNARSVLLYHGAATEGQVETLSLSGVMISFDESVMVPECEICTVEIYLHDGAAPLRFMVEVVYSTLFRVGVQFLSYIDDADERLYQLMVEISPEPESVKREAELLGWSITSR